ncbi:MAG: nucleotide exchange factor GrpE [Anaerolineae bacterium]|nr:nucleotide exchange factor GrpE [Anaerolineae bacterium]MBL6966633.1 nucleotide exchange factor GrpE [Anaerolineales bacterium]
MSKKKKKDIAEEIIEDKIQPEEQDPAQSESAAPAQDEADSPEADSDPEAKKSPLEEIQSKADEYLAGWQRERAEFANYKKRVDRERETTYKNAAGGVIKRFLPVMDDMERALKNRPPEGDGADWAEGIELIYRKLLAILEAEGIAPIEADGAMFDPHLHEAVMKTPSDEHETEQIIEVLQQGYRIGERVLRPATVVVAA